MLKDWDRTLVNLEDAGMWSLLYINQWKIGQSIILTWICIFDAWKNKGCILSNGGFFMVMNPMVQCCSKITRKTNSIQITTQLRPTRNKDKLPASSSLGAVGKTLRDGVSSIQQPLEDPGSTICTIINMIK